MPRTIWKGAVSFGLVHIPVALVPATTRQGIDFDWLDKRSMDRVGYKRINKTTGEDIDSENIVKGVEYEKGHYVVISDDEIKGAHPKATQTVDIVAFVDAKDIFATSFKVVTERNVVYLMGLATRRETDRATDITRGVAGVDKVVRVVEILSEAELASQTRQGGTGPSPNTVNSVAPGARSSVPLPPMEPLPAAGGTTVTPVR